MLVLEALAQAFEQRPVDRAGRQLDLDLPALAAVAEVGGAQPRRLVAAGERTHEHRLHLVEEGRDAAGIDRVDVEVTGANLVELGPREEEADGAEEARHRRHEHRRDAEVVGEPAGVDRPRAAVGDDREVARIAALLRRDRPQRPGHARIRDAVDAVGRLEHREPERPGHALHGSLGERRARS